MKTLSRALLALTGWIPALAAFEIDLAGTWQFHLPTNAETAPTPDAFTDSIQLPGMLTAQGFGEKPSLTTPWSGGSWTYRDLFPEYQSAENFKFPFFLQPPRYYVGPAWYQREFTIPNEWTQQISILHLERAHWHTTVWIDGEEKATGEALGTPHDLDLGVLSPGKHRLLLRVDNSINPVNPGTSAHSVSDHTQGNWNGVVGDIKLRSQPLSHLDTVRIDTENSGIVSVTLRGTATADCEVTLVVTLPNAPEKILGKTTVAVSEAGEFNTTAHLQLVSPALTWDEFHPHLYELTATLAAPNNSSHQITETFGFREVASTEGRFTINGRPLSLRGALDCAIFPRTGHPPTDLAPWQHIMKTCQDYGLNHIRFHSWCPPEAAFIAADEAGIYLQPEASVWSHNDSLLGSGWAVDEWSQRETARMMDHYGNHPSFLMMSHGNEPHGPNHAQWLQDWVARWQKEDDRRLYTTGSGWTTRPGSDFHSIPGPRLQRWGEGLKSRLNAKAPSTDFDFSQYVRQLPDAPVVAHESGQWCAYPDFDLIEKFDGFFKSKNYEVFQAEAEKNGILPDARRFLRDSGRWQTLAYKHDIETALRTPGLGGFQLLGLQDFSGQGTAPVGVVDVFWDPKPYSSSAEFRQFCSETVPLARFPKMVYTTADTLKAELQLSHFGPEAVDASTLAWTLRNGDQVIASGTLAPRTLAPYQLHDLGAVSTSLAAIAAPVKLTFTLGSIEQNFTNSWDLFVYPAKLTTPKSEKLSTRSWNEAEAALAAGKTVFFTPPADEIGDDPEHPLLQGFSPIFWNTAYTTWQPPHTLGMSLDPAHPAFAQFPTDTHTNWQWWELQQNARPFILTAHRDLAPIVEIIDDWFTARRLGFLFEAKVGEGRLLACGLDLTSKLDERPAARQLHHSLMSYLASEDFAPQANLTAAEVKGLLKQPTVARQLGMTAKASSTEPNYPTDAIFDGSNKTLWHTEFTARKPEPPHSVTLHLPVETTLSGLLLTQRQDGNRNGTVKEFSILRADGSEILRDILPAKALNHRVMFPEFITGRSLTIEVHTSHAGPFACLAEVAPLLPEKTVNEQ